MGFRILLRAACCLAATIAAAGAGAMEPGERMAGHAELLSRQLPLPAGDWTVLGRGTNRVVQGDPGAFGTIENAILARRAGGRIDALVEVNVNRLPVGGGWGTAANCVRSDGLAAVGFYRSAVDGFCMFVIPTALGTFDAVGPSAWEQAQPALRDAPVPPSPIWLTVGFRASDRRDVLDVRYHFDPAGLGFRPLLAREWTLDAVLRAPERYAAVSQLTAWGGLAAGLVEDGFRGALTAHAPVPPLPNPWDLPAAKHAPAASPALADLQGRAGRSARIAALDELAGSGLINPADHTAYLRAIANAPPPADPDSHYRLLGTRMLSFGIFRASVDYALAFLVTLNAVMSGYVTATITATHGVVQTLGALWWGGTSSAPADGTTGIVDFMFAGSRPGETG